MEATPGLQWLTEAHKDRLPCADAAVGAWGASKGQPEGTGADRTVSLLVGVSCPCARPA